MQADAPAIELYAESLLAFGEAAGIVSRIEEDLATVIDILKQNPDVRKFMTDPGITIEGKCETLKQLLANSVNPSLLRFLDILTAQDEFCRFDAIFEAFFQKASQRKRKTSGELISARPLPREKIEIIEKEMGRILGKEIHLHARVEPDMLGGITVQVGDRVVDGSLDHYLEEMRRTILAID